MNNRWFRLACFLCVICVLIASSGCRLRRRGPHGPTDLGGGSGMGEGGDTWVQPTALSEEQLPNRFDTAAGQKVLDVTFENVLFAYDSYQIEQAEVSKVEKVAEYMRQHADVNLVTNGHCDERGSNEYNMSLGEHRALAVRAYLVGLGIPGDRVQTRSFGEEKPLDANHSEDAWRLNRRVDFELFKNP